MRKVGDYSAPIRRDDELRLRVEIIPQDEVVGQLTPANDRRGAGAADLFGGMCGYAMGIADRRACGIL